MSGCENSNCIAEKKRLQAHLTACESTLKQVNLNIDRIGCKENVVAKLEEKNENPQPIVSNDNSETVTTCTSKITSLEEKKRSFAPLFFLLKSIQFC